MFKQMRHISEIIPEAIGHIIIEQTFIEDGVYVGEINIDYLKAIKTLKQAVEKFDKSESK